jgi:hypothetical protein
MSYNIYILNLKKKAYKLSHCFKSISPRIDVMFIQERKSKRNKAKKVGVLLWKEASCWCVEAMEGSTSNLQQSQANKSGTCIVMDPNYAKFVSHYGTTWGNQVQWLELNGMFGVTWVSLTSMPLTT